MATVVTTPPATDQPGAPQPPSAGGSRPSEWARKYPPLLALLVAILVAAVVLPSSLNVPQSNPSTTLEFAPVPPDKDRPPPPAGGNLGNLGLGSTSGLTQGGAPGGDQGGSALPAPGKALPGAGKSPRTKKCVGNPPKQTEDALAPPCVADFSGDNFGATYQGVTRDEINILYYAQGNYIYTNTCKDAGTRTPDHEYFDLAKDPQPGEFCLVRAMRVWQQYFNDRFQTYGRFAHFWVYFSGNGGSAEERKADAADNFATVHPFAVIHDGLARDYMDDYLNEMTRRGVMVFDSEVGRSAAFYAKYAPKVWGYLPTIENVAKMFSGVICTKMKDQPVSQYANASDVGKPRKYGLVYSTDPARDDLRAFKDAVVADLTNCGVKIDKTGTFPGSQYEVDNSHTPAYAPGVMADFKQAGITTIIWPSGLETNFSKAGAQIGYTPEVIAAGDRLLESNVTGSTFEDQSFWDHVFIMTNLTAQLGSIRDQQCYQAYKEADPGADDTDAQVTGCENYDQLRQLFTGIQVAGPRLNPQSMDQGYHAIPHIQSTNPAVPACFYESGDYTCVKDAMLEKWDRTASNGQGCYRMIERGKRYFAEIWPGGNIDAQYQQNDQSAPCNTYAASYSVNPNPPDPSNP